MKNWALNQGRALGTLSVHNLSNLCSQSLDKNFLITIGIVRGNILLFTKTGVFLSGMYFAHSYSKRCCSGSCFNSNWTVQKFVNLINFDILRMFPIIRSCCSEIYISIRYSSLSTLCADVYTYLWVPLHTEHGGSLLKLSF